MRLLVRPSLSLLLLLTLCSFASLAPADAGPTPDARLGSGGTDAFGYRWIDSDEPGGPAYAFVDISATGTAVPLSDDDAVQVAFPSGFVFPFYGQDKSSIYIGSNGLLSFDGDSADEYSNDDIPDTSTPNDLVAPLWVDLSPDDAGTVYYAYDAADDRFIVQYDGVRDYGDTGLYTFQVILQADGDLLFQYADVESGEAATSATVGIENADGTDGLRVVYEAPYLKNELAVRFTTQPPGTPAFTSTPALDARAGDPYAYVATATDPNGPGSALTFTAPTAPAWLALTDHGDGTATLGGTPTASEVGYHDVVLEVADADGETSTQAFTVTVTGARTIYVDASAAGAGDGTSWADAYRYLQDALDEVNGDPLVDPVIRVAEGTYFPDEDADGDHTPDDPAEAFRLTRDGVELYGGYAAGGGTRDPDVYTTTLSGDLAQDDDPLAPDTDSDANTDTPTLTDHLRGTNSWNVLDVSVPDGGASITAATVLDGFTVTGGQAVGDAVQGEEYKGGGLRCEIEAANSDAACSPTLRALVFTGNTAKNGGALWMENSTSTLTDVVFTANTAFYPPEYPGDINSDGKGGAVYLLRGTPSFADVAFTNNAAPWGDSGRSVGGALRGDESTPTFADVTFTGNEAYSSGAVSLSDAEEPVFERVTFEANVASYSGGGAGIGRTSGGGAAAPHFTDVDFIDNQAGFYGGGLNLGPSSSADDPAPTFTRVTFRGNTAFEGGGLHAEDFDGTLTDVTFEANVASARGGGYYGEGFGAPRFTDVVFRDNVVDGPPNTNSGLMGGGGAFISRSAYRTTQPTFVNVVFQNNAAYDLADVYDVYGGALCIETERWDGTDETTLAAVLVNVTFSGNWAEAGGGAVYNGASPLYNSNGTNDVRISNGIFWNNYLDDVPSDGDPDDGTGQTILNRYANSTLTIDRAIVPDQADAVVDLDGATTLRTGTLSANPQFGAGLALSAGSPAVDAGTLDALDLDGDGRRDVAADLDGGARVVGGTVDLGAYEYGMFQSVSAQPVVDGQVGFFRLGDTGATVLFRTNDAAEGGLAASRTDAAPTGAGLPPYVVPVRWTITESLDGAFRYDVTLDVSGPSSIVDFGAVDVYKSDDGGATWAAVDSVTVDPLRETVTAVGLTSFSDFAVGSDADVLPVELAAFEGVRDGEAVRLTWRTRSETRNQGFAVERAAGPDGAWRRIGYVEGAGTTVEARAYAFTDAAVPFGDAVLRYRLKQIDLNGAVVYSPVVEVAPGLPGALTLHGAFPNPFRRAATLRYELPAATHVTLEVFDVLGRRVRTLVDAEQPAGRRDVRLDGGDLPAGVYFVRLRTDRATHTTRLVRAR